MIRYRITSGYEILGDWQDSMWVSDMPIDISVGVIKKKARGKKFYEDEMKYVEKCLNKRGLEWVTDGDIEKRPRKKVK